MGDRPLPRAEVPSLQFEWGLQLLRRDVSNQLLACLGWSGVGWLARWLAGWPGWPGWGGVAWLAGWPGWARVEWGGWLAG